MPWKLLLFWHPEAPRTRSDVRGRAILVHWSLYFSARLRVGIGSAANSSLASRDFSHTKSVSEQVRGVPTAGQGLQDVAYDIGYFTVITGWAHEAPVNTQRPRHCLRANSREYTSSAPI